MFATKSWIQCISWRCSRRLLLSGNGKKKNLFPLLHHLPTKCPRIPEQIKNLTGGMSPLCSSATFQGISFFRPDPLLHWTDYATPCWFVGKCLKFPVTEDLFKTLDFFQGFKETIATPLHTLHSTPLSVLLLLPLSILVCTATLLHSSESGDNIFQVQRTWALGT